MTDLFNENPQQTKAIIHQSIFNAELLDTNGLYKGKLGKIILFYNYALHTKNSLYSEFADELLDSVCENIDINNTENIENGLSGMAWGFLYLLKNHFIEGDPSLLLTDIDNILMKYKPMKYADFTFDTGFAGVLFYINCRLSYSYETKTKMPFNRIYFTDINYFIEHYKKENPILKEQFDLYNSLQNTQQSICIDQTYILKKIFNYVTIQL